MTKGQPVSKTWWGQRLIDAVEASADQNRLSRGRSYLTNGRIQKLAVDSTGVFNAQVRGSINAYMGVHKEPLYLVSIELPVIGSDAWSEIIKTIAQRANLLAQLLMKELPAEIEACFESFSYQLVPQRYKELKTFCNCPDWGDPCKHIAGVIYQLAQRIDQDPFTLFELRGLPRQELFHQLSETHLGRTLVAEFKPESLNPVPLDSYYTRPVCQPLNPDLRWRSFWQGQTSLPDLSDSVSSSVSGLVVKRQGDHPPFWSKSQSFLEVMEELYDRVKVKNKDIL